MKIKKLITLLLTIPLLYSFTYTSALARDCSNPNKFHEKMMCKLSGDSVSTSTSEKSNEKKGNSIWQKIKNFGGKNIGEAG